MKELSIEQKAKAYDEALAKAKEQYNYPCMRSCMGILEDIFPELVESEGENIRKWCISHFKECINVIKDNDEYKEYLSNKVLAWLERQGEHANFSNKIQIGDKVTRNEDGVLVNLSQLQRVAKKDEKQGEQKPAWSDEDERLCQCLIEDQEGFLDEVNRDKYGHSEIISDLKEMYHERIDWIKSLKKRIGGKV